MADKLNNDCLVLIFRYLPLPDLIKIERVSRKWREISRMTWYTWSKKKTNLELKQYLSHSCANRTNHVVKSILDRCCRFLTEITFCFLDIAYSADILLLLAASCDLKLRKLQLRYMHASAAGMKALSQNCKSIEWLQLDNVTGNFENELEMLLEASINLVGLELTKVKIKGKCLRSIESKCFEYLEINDCYGFDLMNVEKLAGQLKYCQVAEYMGTDERMRNLDVIGKMTNLTTLHLYAVKMDDCLLFTISKYCVQLVNINIVLDKYVTSRSVGAILDLPLLETIRFHNKNNKNLYEVWRMRESRMPRLRSLELEAWTLKDMGIIWMIKMSPRLENLTLDTCELPTDKNKFVKAISRIVRGRVNDAELYLKVKTYWNCLSVIFDEEFYKGYVEEDSFKNRWPFL